MATRKNIDQQIELAQAEIKQGENRLKELIQKKKDADKKARTHRLIERGAILESLIAEAQSFSNDQIKTFLEKAITTNYALNILNGLKAKSGETSVDVPAGTETRGSAEEKVGTSATVERTN